MFWGKAPTNQLPGAAAAAPDVGAENPQILNPPNEE